MSKDNETKEALKEMQRLAHSAIVKSRWYALHPEVILPELLGLAIKTTVVVATLIILGIV